MMLVAGNKYVGRDDQQWLKAERGNKQREQSGGRTTERDSLVND